MYFGVLSKRTIHLDDNRFSMLVNNITKTATSQNYAGINGMENLL